MSDMKKEDLRNSTPSSASGLTLHSQELVRQLHEDLLQLLRQRAEVTRRIGIVKKTALGLSVMFGEGSLSAEMRELLDLGEPLRKPGLTKACRTVLIEADSSLSAREICHRISVRAPALIKNHKDPLASVTTILNRLVGYGEAKRVLLPNNRREFQWMAESSECR